MCAKETTFAAAKQEICVNNHQEIFIFPQTQFAMLLPIR